MQIAKSPTGDLVQHLEQAVTQSMDGFALLDREGFYYYVNAEHARTYGYVPEDFIGQNWSFLYYPDVAEIIRSQHMVELQSVGHWRGELEGKHKDGSRLTVEVSLTSIFNDAGEYDGLVCNCRDVTERKLTEASLSHLQRIDALGQLSGGIAHDFNNLLCVIMGNLELALSADEPPSHREQLDHAYQATQRGAALVSRLLSFARAQHLEPDIIPTATFLAEFKAMLDRTLEENIDLSWDIPASLWSCYADPRLLENAILNLVFNSRDALPSGGSIRIAAKNGTDPNGNEVVYFCVSDTGVGMTDEVRQQIFDPFYSTKPVNDRGGLGLSITHGFVSQSGGEIRVSSELGKGTDIEFYLPRSHTEPVAPYAFANEHPAVVTGKQIRMLVVEDDPTVMDTTVAMSNHLGFEVSRATDGAQAIELLEKEPTIRLVLTDVRLPGPIQGDDIAEHLHQHYPSLPCVLMTGYAPSPKLSPNVAGRLAKPFSLTEIASVVTPLMNP